MGRQKNKYGKVLSWQNALHRENWKTKYMQNEQDQI